jgi:exopolyphosphatase / guanosine-5'-triphosphate,3'-diphosphate pyrophosphatase
MAEGPVLSDTSVQSQSRPRRSSRGPVAIVDIGSNSVRIVIYESQARSPSTLDNEKAICAIGRDMVSTGRLHAEGCALALRSLARFRYLADGLGIVAREAVATAAARDASNGAEFVARAEAAWGAPVRVLSGEEEARLAAQGVVAGIPHAEGLVADLGGGSLDMVTVSNGATGSAFTLPYGPLRLMDLARGESDKARDIVDKGLNQMPFRKSLEGSRIFAVGGIWRSLARVDMDKREYPLHVLQQYTMPRGRALDLCKLLSRQSRKSLDKIKVVSRRRLEAMPAGAVVLERLLLATGAKEVVVSAYGLREGLLFDRLAEDERAKDPLLEFASAVNQRMARNPEFARELFRWSAPLFVDDTSELRRVREAAFYFADVGWRRHPDDRVMGAFRDVLNAPFAGADHRTRTSIASSIFYRYSGDEEFPKDQPEAVLVSEADATHALRVGLTARLGFWLSASAPAELAQYRLRMTPTRIILEVPRRQEINAGDAALKRVSSLAAAFGRKGETLLV